MRRRAALHAIFVFVLLFLAGAATGALASEQIQATLIGQLPASRMVLVSLPAQDNGWNGPTTAYDMDWTDILADYHRIGSLNCNPENNHSGLVKVLFVQSGGYYSLTCWESEYKATPTRAPTEIP